MLCSNPFATEEWCYYIDDNLVAVSYIDPLPDGLSGVYFFLDPDYYKHSLGTWIALTMIDRAKAASMPYVYLGYYVEGCRSMEYKDRFAPNEILGSDLQWHSHCK